MRSRAEGDAKVMETKLETKDLKKKKMGRNWLIDKHC